VDDSQTTIKMDLNESKLRKQALGMALADQTTQSYHESDIGDEDIIMNEDDDELFDVGFDNDSDNESEEKSILQTKTGKNVMKSSSNLHGSNLQSAEFEFLKQISSDEEDDSAPSSQLNSLALRDSNSRLPTQMPTMGPTLQPTNNFESLGGFHEPNLSLEDTGGNAADFMADLDDDEDLAVFNSDDEEEMNTPPLTQVPKFRREPSSRSMEGEDLLDEVNRSEKKQTSCSKEISSEMDSRSLRSDNNQKQTKKSAEVVEKKSIVKTPAKQPKKVKESVSSDAELIEEKPSKKEVPKRDLPKTILKNTKADVKESTTSKPSKNPVKESVESSEGEDEKPVFVKEKKNVESSKKDDKVSSDDAKKTPAKKSSGAKEKSRTELKSSKDSAKEEVKSSVKTKAAKEEVKKVVKEKPQEEAKKIVKEKPIEAKKKTSADTSKSSHKTPVKSSSREDKENNKHAANGAQSSSKTFKKQSVRAEDSDEDEQETRVKSVKKDVKKHSSSSLKKEKERTKSPRHSPTKSKPTVRKEISELMPREVKALEDLAAFYPAEGLEDDDEDNPRKATKLFAGVTFVVTGCKRAKKSLSEITEVITRNGGKIAIFEQVGVKKTVRAGVPSLILIGARAERTNKYILALAAGVPCVHYNWLYQCRHDGKIVDLDEFLLPAGYSLEKEERISQLPEVLTDEDIEPVFLIPKGRSLDAARIEVVGSPEFKEQWIPILSAAGAKVVQRLFSAYENMNLIFSDQEPADIVWEKSQQLGLPLCNVEWAIQCIISHQYIDPMSREEYRVLVEEGSGSEQEDSAEEISLQSHSEE
jgi:hypothetical protein